MVLIEISSAAKVELIPSGVLLTTFLTFLCRKISPLYGVDTAHGDICNKLEKQQQSMKTISLYDAEILAQETC